MHSIKCSCYQALANRQVEPGLSRLMQYWDESLLSKQIQNAAQ